MTIMNRNARDDDEPDQPKRLVREDLAPKKISHLQFGLLSPEDMQRLAEFEVTAQQLFTLPSRAPATGGCLDPRLGVSDKVSTCATCKRKLVDCAGHFGYIRLALPVFHIGFLRHTLQILQSICKSCSRVLLDPKDRLRILNRMRNPKTDVLAKSVIFKKLVDSCKKVRECPYCKSFNGTVKRVTGAPTLKIIHECFKGKKAEEDYEEFIDRLEMAIEANRDVANVIRGGDPPAEDLLPTRVHDLFSKIPDDDCEVLWIDPTIGRPEHLILKTILVPPVPIRPSVAMDGDGGSNEDDLTVKLQEIIGVNKALELALTKGPQTRTIIEEWDFLQTQVAQYINGEMPGLQRPIGSKPIRGLCQRLKGKQGRFRGNLSGKRVDFSSRTVISPDPNLSVEHVGVPLRVAKIMTYPERVSKYNIEKLRKCVENGPHVHPGAVNIRLRDGFTKSLEFGDRKQSAKNLRIGDVVERHMEDGDVVLFNRQPSLHRISIMAHIVKVMDWRTFRFNTCVCAPYNADFDGDEMNMHLPQTEEARTEAQELMGVKYNLTTPRNGEPMVAASQDFLSAAYLLTQRDQFFTKEKFCQLVCYFSDAGEHIDLPIPAILKPIQLWTGKQVFSMLLRPNKASEAKVNFEGKEKNYTSNRHFCRNDGWVAFRSGELISGNIAKKSIGDGSKKGLLYILLRDCGAKYAAECMSRWAKFCSRYMGGHRGLSIGISDVTPSDTLLKLKRDILEEGYQSAKKSIQLYEEGKLELRPGCDMLQSLEEILNGILGRLRESAGQEAMKALVWSNSPRIMAECGSKGSPLNISQMMSCVGQQAVNGMRIQNGFAGRTLPHFEVGSLTPSAKGFVANSFYTGLTATEFFFHMMGGREGLVDTAVKTAETGYMARRLMKALEDLSVQYDRTIRNSENLVVQFTYGDDGLNPDKMEENCRPIDVDRLLLNVQQENPFPEEPHLEAAGIKQLVHSLLSEKRFKDLLPEGQKFLDEIRDYFECANQVEKTFLSTSSITKSQLELIIDIAYNKWIQSFVEAGEAIGAIGAQSISEPGTQMTLKTFHFSGISSMNVTLGVPRIKEIINAAKLISTPIITAKLVHDESKIAARIVKAEIEKTTLGEISEYIEEVYSADGCYINIKLDHEAIDQLKLNVDAITVKERLVTGTGSSKTSPIRFLDASHIIVSKTSLMKLRIIIPEITAGKSTVGVFFAMQMLKEALPSVIVQGIPTISRAVINTLDQSGKPRYNLLMEGYGLREVMGCPGIDGCHTTTNHVIEVEKVLGVEAARSQIISEIEHIMRAYGIGIDPRHLLLLSDVMTFKGEVLGITRFGISKMRESVLTLASFEMTTDHLFDAAVHSRTDAVVGVGECIMMGLEVPVGTGLPSLHWKCNT